MSTTTTSGSTPESTQHNYDADYNLLLVRTKDCFLTRSNNDNEPLFTTDAEGLYEAYLNGLPLEQRQHHTCSACRTFIERFGGLVLIDDNGETMSAMWNPIMAPPAYRSSIDAMLRIVRRARVTGVFLSSEATWGQPMSRTAERTWYHFSVRPNRSRVFKSHGGLFTPSQKMAAKREDHNTVARALADFTQPMIEQALTLLDTESLYRSEKVIGPAKWLANLHALRSTVKGHAKDNILWREVAKAPDGFCHPRSSMIGTLLEDIAAGMSFEQVSRRFAEKMHPAQYQRPQAPSSSGTIEQAEKLVAKLGVERSLARRFARLEEIQTIWKPASRFKMVETSEEKGVFSHLRGSKSKPGLIESPVVTMTWEKFSRVVLPTAEEIQFFARWQSDGYFAMLTAVHPDAPPILQWDHEDQRNPVSWYFHRFGSSPSDFNLETNAWHKVNAISLKPSMWGRKPLLHQGEGVFFIINRARDNRYESAGIGLFPEILKSEFRGIRSVIEAHSQSQKIEGIEESTACGIALEKGGCSGWNQKFRVKSGKSVIEYQLDRWD